MSRFSLILWGFSLAGLNFQEPVAESPKFEGGLVIEAPGGTLGLVPGDVLLSINGRVPESLPRMRRELGERVGGSVKAKVNRHGREMELEWTPTPGTYRLTDWPSPAEIFRRTHAAQMEEPGPQAAGAAILATGEGRARGAARMMERARTLKVKDPWLDWAEATLKIRYEAQPREADAPLTRAQRGLERSTAPMERRLLGLCRIAAGYRELYYGGNPDLALKLYQSARATGVDASDLARAVATALPQDSEELRRLRREIFEDDPLDRAAAEWLSRQALSPQENARYAEWAQRLSGAAPSDPALVLAGHLARVHSDLQAREALWKLLSNYPKLEPEDRARALDALGRACQRSGEVDRAFECRREALEVAPTLARARSAATSARTLGRYAPVLRLLRSLCAVNPRGFRSWDYLAEYSSLSADELVWEGDVVIEEAVRLARVGRPEDAAAFLTSKAKAYEQPEFQVAAGLLLADAGLAVNSKDYFEEETNFWGNGYGGGPECRWRRLLLETRIPEEKVQLIRMSLDRMIEGKPAAIRLAIQAALAWRQNQPTVAEDRLKDARDALGGADSATGWLPIYAEGRFCRTLRDFILALADKHNLKLPGFEHAKPEVRPAAAPPARVEVEGAPVSLAELNARAERIAVGTLDLEKAPALVFQFRAARSLKGSPLPAKLAINGGAAQEWHSAALEARAHQGDPAVFFELPSGEGLLYLDRIFVRIEWDPRAPWEVIVGCASRIELGMTRTYDGPVDELAQHLEKAQKGQEPWPALQPQRPAHSREGLGVPTVRRGMIEGEFPLDEEGFIRHWLVLGPIELGAHAAEHTAKAQGEFFDREWFPGQSGVRPRAGDAPILDKPNLEWEPRQAWGYELELGHVENSISIGVVYLYCDREIRGVVLAIGSDDGSRWTLNGEELIRVHSGRNVRKDDDRSRPVVLQAGLNVLAMAVINGGGQTAACARFLDRSGSPVRGLVCRYSPRR